jgi:translation initiation factor eIF-2B subunit gamma
MGTAEILRLPEVRELVTSDFVVLPCDLVCEVGGETLLQAWQVKCASLIEAVGANKFSNDELARCSGGLGVWYDAKANTPIKKEETDFIATAPLPSPAATPPRDSLFSGVSKLVYSTPTDSLKDSMEERGGLSLRHGLLRANPQIRMLTTHRDAHIYIFPQWVMEFVKRNERMESISEDVVGWWAKVGWQAGLAEKLHIKEVCSPSQNDEGSLSSPTSDTSPGLPSLGQQSNGLIEPTTNMALDLIGEKAVEIEVPSILAYVHSGAKQATGSLVRRVDTAQLLLAISLQLAKLPSLEETGPDSSSPYAHSRKVAYPEGVKSRTTITKQDCLIGENVTVEEKVAIKESVVGIGCQIDEGAKISQCLLMEGVKVGKNCKLTKCILGKRCVIGDGSVLTDCEVQENLLVEPRSEPPWNPLEPRFRETRLANDYLKQPRTRTIS